MPIYGNSEASSRPCDVTAAGIKELSCLQYVTVYVSFRETKFVDLSS